MLKSKNLKIHSKEDQSAISDNIKNIQNENLYGLFYSDKTYKSIENLNLEQRNLEKNSNIENLPGEQIVEKKEPFAIKLKQVNEVNQKNNSLFLSSNKVKKFIKSKEIKECSNNSCILELKNAQNKLNYSQKTSKPSTNKKILVATHISSNHNSVTKLLNDTNLLKSTDTIIECASSIKSKNKTKQYKSNSSQQNCSNFNFLYSTNMYNSEINKNIKVCKLNKTLKTDRTRSKKKPKQSIELSNLIHLKQLNLPSETVKSKVTKYLNEQLNLPLNLDKSSLENLSLMESNLDKDIIDLTPSNSTSCYSKSLNKTIQINNYESKIYNTKFKNKSNTNSSQINNKTFNNIDFKTKKKLINSAIEKAKTLKPPSIKVPLFLAEDNASFLSRSSSESLLTKLTLNSNDNQKIDRYKIENIKIRKTNKTVSHLFKKGS